MMQWTRSITGRTTLQMSLRIAAVIMITAFLSYFHVISKTEEAFINDLKTYVEERGLNESKIFKELEAKHAEIRQEVTARYQRIDLEQVEDWYQQNYPLQKDGTRRLLPSEYTGREDARGRKIHGLTGMVGIENVEDPDSVRIMPILYDILCEYGPSLETYLPNIYFSTPDGNFTIYWPDFPAAQTISAEEDMSLLEWVYIADQTHNPERRSVWTGLYFDPLVDSWMLSIETPIDVDGRHIATIGQDILLTDILSRTSNQSLPGTYNIVFSSDGSLIANPGLELPRDQPAPNISNSSDPLEQFIFKHTRSLSKETVHVIDHNDTVYLAITEIAGPEWCFVTVYPKKRVKAIAFGIAQFILALGILSLITEIVLLYFVFRKNITAPLFSLMQGVKAIQDGRSFEQDAINTRPDEFGELGRTVKTMSETIASREAHLKATRTELLETNQQLELRVQQRTQELADSNAALRQKAHEVSEAHDEALKANETKSRFLANMSHELRTPLNGILGMTQHLETEELADEHRDKISIISQSGYSLLEIVGDILDLSKVEAAKMEFNPKNTLVREELKNLYKLWQYTAKQKGLTITLKIDETMPDRLYFDPLRVRQCISNLISNSIKFTDSGSVTIEAAAQLTSEGSYFLTVKVSDTGIGIAEKELPLLFNAFEQIDNSSTRAKGGTGLGLAIARELARLMHGDITVQSERNKGSCFALTFIAQAASDALEVTKQATPQAAPISPDRSLRGKRILIVDDNAINRKVIQIFLKPIGAEIVEASNGQQALQRLENEPFDLLLLDINMPLMDGPSTIKSIRESNRPWSHIPTIALTADAMLGDRERYLSMEMDEYLSKPIDRQALLCMVQKFIGSKS